MKLLAKIIPPIVTVAVLVYGWHLAVKLFDIPEYQLPTPLQVWEVFEDPDQRRVLIQSLILTAKAAGAGFGLSVVIGVAVGMILASSRWLERAIYPFAVFLQTVPLVVIAPLLVIWLDYGLPPVIAAACIVSVFPVIANTLTGFRSVDPALVDMFRLYRASWLARLFKLRLPAALPSIFTGLRIAAGLAVIGTVVGELVAGSAGDDAGLGLRTMTYFRESRTDGVFAAVGLASVFGLALFVLVNLASYLTLRHWHASEQER